MKKSFFYILLLCHAASLGAATPIAFEDFKRLPPSQRDEVTANANSDEKNPSRWKIINWWWRLYIGEDAWLRKEEQRLIDQKNMDALSTFLITYQHLRESCLRQEWTQENGKTFSQSERLTRGAQYGDIAKKDAAIYPELIPLLASLKPSAELVSLNDKAQQLTDELYKDYPDFRISREQMSAVDSKERVLVEQLKGLPQMTAAQLQSAIEALPEDKAIPRGLPIPTK